MIAPGEPVGLAGTECQVSLGEPRNPEGDEEKVLISQGQRHLARLRTVEPYF
jgi:hypothetical protein